MQNRVAWVKHGGEREKGEKGVHNEGGRKECGSENRARKNFPGKEIE